VALALLGQHEDRLRVVQLARERLEQLLGDVASVGEHRQLVAGERAVGEDVGDDVAIGGHDSSLAGTSRRPAV
jgi:hypothetical protein